MKIEKTDRLSRRLSWNIETKNNNKNQKLVKEEQVQNLIEIVVKESEIKLIEKYKEKR